MTSASHTPLSPADTSAEDRSGSSFRRLLKFGIVGSAGYLWDTGTVYALLPVLGLGTATLVAYFVAATLNWMANRFWTFGDVGRHEHPVLQWLRFLTANSLGFFLNRGTVYALFYFEPFCREYPFIALAAGSFAGMFANFALSKRLVFRERPPNSALDLAEIATGVVSAELPDAEESGPAGSDARS
ncbi:GtrA family protein [Acetobacter musti]|uniref:GtrA family protein n=1 Tax=Acetobacter musti TaxID=864732 RepID=A0ABX0JMP1_9PROT|nr:GtrA family protein [Acetobacter musti]NHN84668.1 GtrA family protein [Acetobacter musti]